MERITINVGKKTAEEWEKVSPKVRSRMERSFAKQIDKWINRSKFIQLNILLDEISDEAEANGLTEDILQEILNEDG